MRKTIASVISTAFLCTSLLTVSQAVGMPPGGMGGMGAAKAPALRAAVVEDLTVTLNIPADSPYLVDRTLPKGAVKKVPAKKGAKGTLNMQVPVVADEFAYLPMAVIDQHPLTVGDFRRALYPEIGPEGEVVATVAKQAPLVLLDRLVNSRVMVREGREIGFDQLPEVVQMVWVFRRQQLRDQLSKQHLAGITADPAEVERLYVESAKESRIKAMLFDSEDDAKLFAAQLQEGGNFDELAARFVEEKKGESKGGAEGEFVPLKDMQPQLAKAIAALAPGQVTPVLPQDKRFTLIQLLEARVPENPHLRKDAEQRAKNFAGNTALVALNQKLLEKHVVLDKQLFEGLDFTKDFETLRQDKRVLAEIKGAEPFLVAELVEALRNQYYHGVQRAIEQGKVESDRIMILNEELFKRAWVQEALEQGIDKGEEFQRMVEEYEDSIIFGAFVQKGVVPSVTLAMEDLRSYYNKNLKDFSSPKMIGLRSMTFRDMAKAQAALDSLRRGTDFPWLQSTVEGIVPHDHETPGLLELEGKLISLNTMPAGLVKILGGATPGQYLLYADGKEFFYVLRVEQVVPAHTQPFEEVQSTVLRTVFNKKLEKALQDWGKKLRKAYKVEVYVKGFNKKEL